MERSQSSQRKPIQPQEEHPNSTDPLTRYVGINLMLFCFHLRILQARLTWLWVLFGPQVICVFYIKKEAQNFSFCAELLLITFCCVHACGIDLHFPVQFVHEYFNLCLCLCLYTCGLYYLIPNAFLFLLSTLCSLKVKFKRKNKSRYEQVAFLCIQLCVFFTSTSHSYEGQSDLKLNIK